MAKIELVKVTKRFGNTTVLENLDLTIEDGEFTVLIGASGCGKTTLLRMIAGIGPQTSGQILMDGVDISDLPPGKRDLAMVFQNYAIYPTMSVRENIEYGLKNKKVPTAERNRLIEEISEILGIADYLKRRPSQLSGGQRQRVALARAMVKKPKVFLMDEPLSNLDAKLRAHMRVELIELHKKLNTTFVYVTHDQVEAMSMADRIILMDKGVIQQEDSPSVIYNNPCNRFTAQFIGSPQMNILKVPDTEFFFGFRPEKIELSNEKSDKFVQKKARIVTKEMLGSETLYQLYFDNISVMAKSLSERFSDEIYFSLNREDILLFDKAGARIYNKDNRFADTLEKVRGF
ncbi:MAG: ABC transporter ATP-binding protein [Clostridiales bacterium]|nr:ABC transporter ATP-binding protein [Clostridiales bacterium]